MALDDDKRPERPEPVLRCVRWAVRASMSRRGTAAARGPQCDILQWLLSSLFLPLSFLTAIIPFRNPARRAGSPMVRRFNC
jgi:hypothetical protein